MLFVVIPVFNRKEFTRKCLISLRDQSYKDFKIVIVDDGSSDGTPEMLESEFPEVVCLKGDGNLWWTASVNLGIEYALKNGSELVMTLNNDTIAAKSFMEQMISRSQKMPDTLLGAFAVDQQHHEPVYGGGKIKWLTASIQNLLEELPEKERKGLHEVDHFPGRGLLIPRKVFEKIGLFNDKELPHYFADYDFSHQAYKNGFKIYCNYDAVLYTYPEESGDHQNRRTKSFQNYRNHLFGIKGGGNLRNFTTFALRNCPKAYLPSFLIAGYTKRFVGYWLK
jgi:GT2 family glycosyltransferase